MIIKRVCKIVWIALVFISTGIMAVSTKVGAENSHRHVWDKNYEISATCVKDGIIIYTCDCGEYQIEAIKAAGHQFSAVERKEPTCNEMGWESHEVCTLCGAGERLDIPILEHEIVQHSAQEPTCGSVGWEAYEACTVCDYTTYKEIPKLEHENIIEEIWIEATCETLGVVLHVCLDCKDYLKTETLEKLGHAWGNAMQTINGVEYICQRCFERKTENMGLGHTHAYDQEQIVEEATCQKEGLKMVSCVCGDSLSKTIPKSGHDYENGMCRFCGSLKDVDSSQTSNSGTGNEGGSVNPPVNNGGNNQAQTNYKLHLGILTYVLNKDETGYICTGIEEEYCNQIIIPDTYNGLPVTEIAKNTFMKMYHLHRVTIGKNIEKVGKGAFHDCTNLVEVYNCSKLKDTQLGNLTYCLRETIYTQPFESKIRIDKDGFITYNMYNENYLIGYVGTAKHITIPNNVTILSRYAFADMDIEEITISASVKEIECYVFAEMPKLKGVIFETKTGWYWDEPGNGWTEQQMSNASLMADMLSGDYASKFLKKE